MKPFKEAEGYAEDLQAAYDYYKAYSPQTAERFLTAYQEATEFLKRRPRISRPRQNEWRQMIIHDYPIYSIFYKELSICWLLAGVIPTIRDPDLIQARLLLREVPKKKRANKAPEPMSRPVTDRADERFAPGRAVAHL